MKLPWSKERQSIPLCENLVGFLNLVFRPGKAKLHFSGSARDDNFDRGQTAPLHTQVKLFMGFVKPVVLKTVHGSASAARQLKAMTNIAKQGHGSLSEENQRPLL